LSAHNFEAETLAPFPYWVAEIDVESKANVSGAQTGWQQREQYIILQMR